MSQQQPKSEPQKNPSNNELAKQRTELAKFRNRAAADRTLMAWMRTCLSLIGFGFGIPTLVHTLQRGAINALGKDIVTKPERASIILGLAFIATGLFGMSTALISHNHILKSISDDNYTYDNKIFNSTAMASVALLCIGIVSFIAVVIQILV